jgi:hypothetical protein
MFSRALLYLLKVFSVPKALGNGRLPSAEGVGALWHEQEERASEVVLDSRRRTVSSAFQLLVDLN